jgi:hypothetical protein
MKRAIPFINSSRGGKTCRQVRETATFSFTKEWKHAGMPEYPMGWSFMVWGSVN